jgi:hypothetical protein
MGGRTWDCHRRWLALVNFSLTVMPARGLVMVVRELGARHIDRFRKLAMIPYDRSRGVVGTMVGTPIGFVFI